MRLNRLRELREERNMSQQTLAKLVNSSQQSIYKYENGITEPNIQLLKSLADVLPQLTNTTGRECCLTTSGWMNAIVTWGSAL